MRFGVLGPLEVRVGSEQLAIKGAKERRLLALLLSRANKAVPVDHIIEALWGTEPPPRATKSVQVYAVWVRKMLEPRGRAADGSVLSRRGAGYALSVGRGQVDALQFADLVATAREAAAAGAHDIVARLLGEALSLWRGSAYADFQDTLFGAAEAARLEEMRLAALEARIDADLALGRHAEATAELEALVHECPLRERFWSQLMLALYRCGRQSDALLAFRRARRSLIEEIGVEPGPGLRALEVAILAHDPGLGAPDAPSAGPPELPLTLEGHAGDIFGGAFAPDGQTLYTDGLDSSVIRWDASGRRSFGVTTPGFQRIPLKPGPGIWPYAGWSADRRRAVLGYQSGLIATIDTATGRLVARDKPIKEISYLALSPDGRFAGSDRATGMPGS